MNGKLVKSGILLALAGAALFSSVACSTTATADKVTSPAVTAKATSVPAATSTVLKPVNAVTHVTTDGRLSFVEDRKMTFRTSGNVALVNVSELDKVTKGQVLAKLDTTSLEQAVTAAELGIKTIEIAQTASQLDLKQAEYGVSALEADMKQLQNAVKAATIDLDAATDNFRKITYPYNYSTFAFDVPQAVTYMNDVNRQITEAAAALKAGLTADEYSAVSRKLQDALTTLGKSRDLLARGEGTDVFQSGQLSVGNFWTLRSAQQVMEKAQIAVEGAQNSVTKMALTADNARTTLKKAQAAVDKVNNDMLIGKNMLGIAKTNLENAIIIAPFDGVIADVNVKVGDFLSPAGYAATVAIEIVDNRRMEMAFNVNELDIPKVKLGQKVSIKVDAVPNASFDSVVTSISSLPVIQFGTLSYEVKVVFDVPQNSPLKAGMGATADIIVDSKT